MTTPFDPIAHTRQTTTGSGDFVNFKTIGDVVTMTVTNARPWKSNKANKDGSYDEATALDGTVNGEKATLVLSGHKGTAFLEAVAEARVTHLVYPFTIHMQYHGDRDTGEIQPMKLYRAKVEMLQSTPVASLPVSQPPAGPAPQGQPPAPPSAFPPAPAPVAQGSPFGDVVTTAPQPPAAPGGPPPGQPMVQVNGTWMTYDQAVAAGHIQPQGAAPAPVPPVQGGNGSPVQGGNEVANLFG